MNELMTPKMGLIENCKISVLDNDLKLVKGASIFSNDGIIYISHYGTIIFAYDSKSKICEIDYNCSMTSNKQIRYALDHFGLSRALCIDVHEGDKMNYSGPLR